MLTLARLTVFKRRCRVFKTVNVNAHLFTTKFNLKINITPRISDFIVCGFIIQQNQYFSLQNIAYQLHAINCSDWKLAKNIELNSSTWYYARTAELISKDWFWKLNLYTHWSNSARELYKLMCWKCIPRHKLLRALHSNRKLHTYTSAAALSLIAVQDSSRATALHNRMAESAGRYSAFRSKAIFRAAWFIPPSEKRNNI